MSPSDGLPKSGNITSLSALVNRPKRLVGATPGDDMPVSGSTHVGLPFGGTTPALGCTPGSMGMRNGALALPWKAAMSLPSNTPMTPLLGMPSETSGNKLNDV